MRAINAFLGAAALAACAGTHKEGAKPAPPRHETLEGVDGAACAVPAPARTVAVAKPLTADDLVQISRVVGESPSGAIVRIEDRNGGRESSSDADMVLTVMLYGGYDRCLHLGISRGSIVERVRGRWTLVGKSGSSTEYSH